MPELAAADIGGATLSSWVNASMYVLTREHRGINACCIYFTDDEVGDACMHHARGADGHQRSYGELDNTELREAGVYSLKTGNVERIGKHSCWPLPAWFMPSFP
ncbi:unnamed protein product [Urochloa humidicola]